MKLLACVYNGLNMCAPGKNVKLLAFLQWLHGYVLVRDKTVKLLVFVLQWLYQCVGDKP